MHREERHAEKGRERGVLSSQSLRGCGAFGCAFKPPPRRAGQPSGRHAVHARSGRGTAAALAAGQRLSRLGGREAAWGGCILWRWMLSGWRAGSLRN